MSNDQELIVMNSQLYDSIKDILEIAKNKVNKAVNFAMVDA